MGSLYKRIAKVLASRMKKAMSLIISPRQSAFVQGRQILEKKNLIANECIDSRIRSGEPGVLCKIDIEKAYDHVNWRFMEYLLRRMGFGVKWRKWIKVCITTASFPLLHRAS